MKKIKIQSSEIRSWIQTVAAIVAIAGAIFAFNKAFENDKNLQYQISKLETIASESKIQTDLLRAERDSLTTRWKQQIRPVFEIECDFFSGGVDEIPAFLVNNGKIATDINVSQNNDNGFNVKIPFKNLGEGMKGKIFINFINKRTARPEQVDLDITLSFKDASGLICYQQIVIKKFAQTIEARMRL